MSTCARIGIPVTCVCDSKSKGLCEYKGKAYKIISTNELLEHYTDAFVRITPWQYEQEIYASLCASGFPETQIYFLRYPDMLSPEDFQETQDERNQQRLQIYLFL